MSTSTNKSAVHARARAALERMTDDEDLALAAASKADADNPPLTEDEMGALAPSAGGPKPKKTVGRPKAERTKVSVTLRIDPDVLQSYKDSGKGWQARMNKTLKANAPKAKGKAAA